jgi:hypothetical protein
MLHFDDEVVLAVGASCVAAADVMLASMRALIGRKEPVELRRRRRVFRPASEALTST